MHHVYILYSERIDRYYVGRTENIEKRIEDHNAGRSTYTRRGRPWRLVYQEEFERKAEAIDREIEIKKRKSRRYIEKLVQSVPVFP
jgi:putative endonuclease